jgi:hypothetical protein
MVKKGLIVLIAIFMGVLAKAQQVGIFTGCNYGGQSVYLSAGRYYSYQMKIANDRLSSLQVPYGMKVTVYEHDNFEGRSKTYFSNTPCLESEWRNTASSIIIEFENGQQGQQTGQNDYVVLYTDCYQRGVSQTLRPGSYTGSQLGMLKYNISSFTISGNVRIKLYLNNEYASGNAITHDASVSCLMPNQNDKTGSLVIEYIQASQGNNNAGDDFATFYTQCNFGGNAVRLMPGNYSGARLGLFKNNIASIQVPSGLRVKAYSSENMFGSSSLLTEDAPCLDNNLLNRIASLVVEYRSGFGNTGNNQQGANEQVIIYADDNYRGQSATLLPGNYPTMAAAGNFPDKAISSLSVPQGYRVVLYELENFGGKSFTVTSSRSNFFLTRWNDKTSSIAVFKDR